MFKTKNCVYIYYNISPLPQFLIKHSPDSRLYLSITVFPLRTKYKVDSQSNKVKQEAYSLANLAVVHVLQSSPVAQHQQELHGNQGQV